MRVVIFEDNEDKYRSILSALNERGVKENSVFRAENVTQFLEVANKQFDLCIVDIRMPGMTGGTERSVGLEILQMLNYSGRQKTPILAITAFMDEAASVRDQFAARGCIIYDYERTDVWHQALDIFLAQARDRGRYDFIIFTALAKERAGYASGTTLKFESVIRHGIDFWDCELEGRTGAIVLMPRMGLINATAVVSRVLEQYAPTVVAMSGICAGIGKGAAMGQLLVTDICWEYQSGKWLADTFEAEPYQVSVDQNTRGVLVKLIEEPSLLKALEDGYDGDHRPSLRSSPQMAIFSSGSAVIASKERLESVKQQHRRVSGIDMEIFGFHRAVELSGQNLKAFSAKAVVDKADEAKNDELHEYGSYVSAQFTLSAIRRLL